MFANHSQKVQRLGNQLDYLGIVILMWGSAIPSIYYGFCCDPHLQIAYWANVRLFPPAPSAGDLDFRLISSPQVSVLASACVVATLHSKFRHPTLRPYRAAMYAGLGLSATVFMVHGVVKYGWAVQRMRMSLDWMLAMGACNLVGAATYAARVPERWYPTRFDIVGNGHQILHVMVVLAGLAHMAGLVRAFEYIRRDPKSCALM